MLSVIRPSPFFLGQCIISSRRNLVPGPKEAHHKVKCFLGLETSNQAEDVLHKSLALFSNESFKTSHVDAVDLNRSILLVDLDPATVKLAIGLIGPVLSAFSFLFIVRIVMSWYPKLPVSKFPYVLAYAPTEPFLLQTRKLIPPLGGVDITPVVWFGLISFLNEILVGPQGLLVLLSQQV
ncbi:hypothetical protein Nepgr_013771 [Nepenthes gracilis]|uniref:Protein COFACTOR ASSEMBLY OF COMPLEX C SUBUNIT B CCB3, chloroplastic n=1 Tax=Nepenthes gracilis TaxID=150966 RepID=A0AAD3SI24_NEPGR|nr:hypothetical protein Nepgr_013771 [Nepenthes gracilis]